MKFLLILNVDVVYINLNNIHSPAHFSAPLGYLQSLRVVWPNCPPSAGDDCLARARALEPRGPLCIARALSPLSQVGIFCSKFGLNTALARHFSENGIHEPEPPLVCAMYDEKVSLQSLYFGHICM